MLKLYSYFRSSAAYRARIGLHWKGLQFEYVPVHIVRDGGEQNRPEFRKINPMGFVPALEHDGFILAETTAILQYLDDIHPVRPLFPTAARGKARVMQLCEMINAGIQPLQNLRVQRFLEGPCLFSKHNSNQWVVHWIEDGFKNLEKMLAETSGQFAFGDSVTAADCFVVPQCATAVRFGVELSRFPNLARVNASAVALEPFKKAHPEKQPDFQ